SMTYGEVAFTAAMNNSTIPLGSDRSPSVLRDGDGSACPAGRPVYRVFMDTAAVPSTTPLTVKATFVAADGATAVAEARARIDHRLPAVVVRYENGNRRTSVYGISDRGRVLFPRPLESGEVRFDWQRGDGSMVLFFETPEPEDRFAFDRPVTLDLKRDVFANAREQGDGLVAELYINDAGQLAASDNFAADGDAPPAALEGGGDAPPFGDTVLHVRGGMNGWSTADPMDYVGNGTYARTIALSPGVIEHKFADADWSTATNFGGPVTAKGLNVGGGSGNLNLEVAAGEGGPYRFHFFSLPGGLNFYRVGPVE
nr:hypothetical protein [Pseudomonadota bacterium]